MTKPIMDGVGDARTPPDEVRASRLKVPADEAVRVPCHGLLPESSTAVGEWSRPDGLHNSLVGLLASAHRVPRFLIIWDSDHGRVASTSPESERILKKWFCDTALLLESGHLFDLAEFIARLDRAGSFLFTLANALDFHLRGKHASRRDVLAAHSKITCSWLEASPLGSVVEMSELWHQSFAEGLNPLGEATIAVDLSEGSQIEGEFAWRLMQTHRLGEEFRLAYRRYISAADHPQ